VPPRTRLGGTLLGVDVGATKVRAGRVGRGGRVRGHLVTEILTDHHPEAVITTIYRLARRLEDQGSGGWSGSGVAIAAQVNRRAGLVLYAPNLAWRNVPFARRLEAALGVPVTVENDARAATWGEWRFGAGRGARALFGLIVGTGIGGAFIQEGRPVPGSIGAAGEIGHLTVESRGRECTCPNRGCLEAYAGGWAIARRAQEREADGDRPISRRSRSARDEVTAEAVVRGARQADPGCQELLAEAESYLASGAVSIVNAFNPDRLVVGGGLALHWPGLLPRLRAEVRRRCQPPAATAVRIVRSRLGPAAPIVGAADLAARRG
jgi:glucokinase